MTTTQIYSDALDALRMSDYTIEFDEWYPAWMIDSNGNLVENEKRKNMLLELFNRAKRELNVK